MEQSTIIILAIIAAIAIIICTARTRIVLSDKQEAKLKDIVKEIAEARRHKNG